MMLQVISKKFFESDNYYSTKQVTIIYSNIRFYEKIIMDIATLEPIETYNGITSYILEFDNVIEEQESSSFQLIAIGKREIVEDLISCFSFWFKGIFTTDKDFIEKLLRDESCNICDEVIPQKIVPSIFRKNIYLSKEYLDEFIVFMKALIGLPNDIYNKVIAVIRQFKDAIITINYNLELSYTMFVATVESLATKFDEYETKWDDCFTNNEKNKRDLEDIFNDMDIEIVKQIKKIIINDTHAKLSMRYQQFVLSFISDKYYLEDTRGIKYPCKESQIRNALKNSYQLRSSYVHALKEIPELLKIEGNSEVYLDEDRCYFTFQGLIRLSRFVIIQFIDQQDKVEKEEVDYFNNLPGIVTAKVASEYWIWKEENYNIYNARNYYQGLLEYISKGEYWEKGFISLNNVCDKIEYLVKGLSSNQQKVPLVCFYLIYNYLIKEELRCKSFEKFDKTHEKVVIIPCIENAILYIVVGAKLPWDLDEINDIYNSYCLVRYHKNTIKIPNTLEICLLLEMVNVAMNEQNVELAIKVLNKALKERPQDEFIKDLFKKMEGGGGIDNIEWHTKYILKKYHLKL